MATAILLPHDCLESSRHRHKPHVSELIYKPDNGHRTRRATVQQVGATSYRSSQKSGFTKASFGDSGLLPIPSHGASLPINIPRKAVDLSGAKKSKPRKFADKSDGFSSGRSSPEPSVVAILQRPKPKETATDVPHHTVKYVKKCDVKVQENKIPSMRPGVLGSVPKFQHESKASSSQRGIISSPSLGLPTGHGHLVVAGDGMLDSSRKATTAAKSRNGISSDGFIQLQRASTDPAVVKHFLEQCPSDGSNDGCHERWAGPAYSSSPSPSSLPLPKFFHPTSRMSGGCASDSPKSDCSSSLSSSLPSLPTLQHENVLDVAVATRSLRKMLNLDP